jgi:hypothetical protein
MSWIEEHPDAPRLDRIMALAKSMIGTGEEPRAHKLEWFGLEEDFDITEEPMASCHAFDAIVMRCDNCDWWCAAEDMEDGVCSECRE